ncbi:MAG: glycosyltransferase family 4 protein [Prevotella sp.]|nr:glycosyltransferase family 4 protein [Prevotella sp.]MCM1075394.1 glycosyltransferase family 4 protein [Ruminococcus sp.]
MLKIDVLGLRGFPGIQGGVERHCEALYPLMAAKFRVFRRKPYIGAEARAASYPNITFTDLPSTRIAGLEALMHTFLAALRTIGSKSNLVHVHNIGPGLFIPMLKLFGKRVVLTYHSPNYEHKKWGRFARFVLRTGESVSLRWSDRIIFVNPAQMQKYSAKVQAKSTHLVNGVNRIERTADKSFLKELGIADTPYALAVGRLTPEKGFEYLVQAVNQTEEVPCLVIAGGSDHSPEYLQKLKALDVNNKVIFTGNLSGEPLRQLYSHASLFVLSSVNEGFPLVLLEAMNYSLPLIASRIPATEIPQLDDSRKFPPADAGALAAKLAETFTPNPEPVQYDLTAYNWQTIADYTLAIYCQICK